MSGMEEILPLLNTPNKASLEEQSRSLRASLKEFERSFTQQNGRKPKQVDIKKDDDVAAKYKQYQRVRDVLSGKLAYERLHEDKECRKPSSRTHSRRDSGVGSSPGRHHNSIEATPRKISRPPEAQFSSEFEFVSPKVALRNVIGPTPHRDGKALGMFDLMPNSGATATPSTSARKRKLEELYQDTPVHRSPLKVIQTPSRRAERCSGDLLDYLAGTPEKTSTHTNGRFSKTPQSEGRKFQLSQFFATPSTQRILFSDPRSTEGQATPLRDKVLGFTPEKLPEDLEHGTTASILPRSTSFKDRLLSASQANSSITAVKDIQPPPLLTRGPPTLRHFRSSTSNILQMKDLAEKVPAQLSFVGDDNFDDDLDALRECEEDGSNTHISHIIVEDSQLDLQRPASSPPADADALARPYKKKGQKRTTRKATIKPVTSRKPATETTYVAADHFHDEEWDEDFLEEANLLADADNNDNDYDDYANGINDRSTKKKSEKAREDDGKDKTSSTKGKRQAGMINPNAQSHMNFKTLKIKNKSSRAKQAGRGRFGRRR